MDVSILVTVTEQNILGRMAANHSTGTTVDARLRWRQSNHDAARICREPDLGHKPTPS